MAKQWTSMYIFAFPRCLGWKFLRIVNLLTAFYGYVSDCESFNHLNSCSSRIFNPKFELLCLMWSWKCNSCKAFFTCTVLHILHCFTCSLCRVSEEGCSRQACTCIRLGLSRGVGMGSLMLNPKCFLHVVLVATLWNTEKFLATEQ